ncbi:MAG TPA: hypothetical protein V6C78_31555 [Crinalium sp.]|jgi:hypothetical protein
MYRHTTGLLFALALISTPVIGFAASAAQAGVIEGGRVLMADRRDSDRQDDWEIRQRRDEILRRDRDRQDRRENCDNNDDRRDDRVGDRQNLCEGNHPRRGRDNNDDLNDIWNDIRDLWD